MIYEPSDDSLLLEEYVKKYAKGKSVLDVGSGSGILAEAAVCNKAGSVLASDINPEAVDLIKSKRIPSIKSNLFEKIKSKFDLIIFNPPYLPRDSREPKSSQLVTTGGKGGDEIILRFLKQARSHIKNNGIILILLSSLTPRKRILKLLAEIGFKHKVVGSRKVFMESLEVWEIKHNNQ